MALKVNDTKHVWKIRNNSTFVEKLTLNLIAGLFQVAT